MAYERSNFCISEYEVASKDILNFFVGKIIELFSSVNISYKEDFITIETKMIPIKLSKRYNVTPFTDFTIILYNHICIKFPKGPAYVWIPI